MRPRLPLLLALTVLPLPALADSPTSADGTILKPVLTSGSAGPDQLDPTAWRPYESGFTREGDTFVCDNGADASARRGAAQTVVLNQSRPEPIIATASARAEGVTGGSDSDFSLYIDLVYDDGTPLYGQSAVFRPGTDPEDKWQAVRVLIVPDRPVRSLSFYLLLRNHAGRARFRDAALRTVSAPDGGAIFDAQPIRLRAEGAPNEGFQLRDVAAGSGFVRIQSEALGVRLDARRTGRDFANSAYDVTLHNTSGRDRALTLVYAVPIAPEGLRWLDDPRRATPVEPRREYTTTTRFHAGSNGRQSLYPMGAVASEMHGLALATDPTTPAFSRFGYNAATSELFLAYDLALTPDRPSAPLRFVRYTFDPAWGFRAAWQAYMEMFPAAFQVRVPRQGLWMPFAPISKVKDWEDFGFAFKEGNDETSWDDAHGILTFRYTEPMTWWMPMPKGMPRTLDAALAEARRLADAGQPAAGALLSSGFHDAAGHFPARLIDAPWNDGAVWSVNSMPGITSDVTDFKNKWNPAIRDRLYGPSRRGDLDGEYVDSSEGYVTDELDFRRDHLAAAETALTFDTETHRPAIFRGLIAFEYVHGLERDVHAAGHLMMANSTPSRLPWLTPLLDVLGTETDWNPQGGWRPMSDSELLYRRALCGKKPFCFLMNTNFDRFGPEQVEKYMKRSLAYGMFPGFFSPDASRGHYFSRPELYDRDRPLFRKYLPLCKLVAEAGWEPLTGATSSDDRVHLERFGTPHPGAVSFLTVFNDSPDRRSVGLTLHSGQPPDSTRELVRGQPVSWSGSTTQLSLDGEDVAVLQLDW